ncbi:hypothetical protein [Leptolyngbya sp. FACHB-261]|uniref:DUF7734 family protein n=1 Tax=Leptolyngbya sp. FACHB-261 TaxID=2692806 RepID=UPI001688C9D1|nr:hypothetical protein [Leptolyngbya sp. FACHB-261]MBD2102907.1 hypothetical protein [Leptolyngbya sp. FACHB-261]
MANPIEQRLEQYTLAHPREVLLVTVEIEGEPDQIAIFKGYSSSLMRPTAFDPDLPVLPEAAKIIAVDRLEGPYDPSHPRYLQQAISWEEFQEVLVAEGL